MSEIVNASDALELDTGHVPKIANTAQNHRMFLHIKYEIVQVGPLGRHIHSFIPN